MGDKPGEYKTVQARILAYAQEIGWTYVPRGDAEKRRGFDRSKDTSAEQAAEASPYFDDLLDSPDELGLGRSHCLLEAVENARLFFRGTK